MKQVAPYGAWSLFELSLATNRSLLPELWRIYQDELYKGVVPRPFNLDS